MTHGTRLFTALLVATSAILTSYNPVAAYYVSIDGNAITFAPRPPITPPEIIATGQLSQTSVTRSTGSSSVCTPGRDCPIGASASAQASLSGTATLGTLSAVASGSASQSNPTPFGPSRYTSAGTFAWQDTVTITGTGDFKVTLTLDSGVSASWPASFSCATGAGPSTATASLELNSGGVFNTINMSDSPCTQLANRTEIRTFHGIAGQTFTLNSSLRVSAVGAADIAFVAPSTSIAVSSSADVHTGGIFKLDAVTPGATYTTESGVLYGSIIPNQPPVANAGMDQTVRVGSSVSLDGTGSADPDGNIPLTFAWSMLSRPSGSNATLSNASDSMPSFTADKMGDYLLSLTVKDSLLAASVPVQVKVSTTNSSPIADAGPDQAVIALGSTIHLNGVQSYDPDGDVITYTWSLAQVPTGSAATLSSASAVAPIFTADVQGTYVATLVVMDTHGAFSDSDSVTVSFTNVKPVANGGGNQAGSVGQTIGLNGTRSTDANFDPLTYSWAFVSKPLSSVAALTNPAGAVTQFTADRAGTYIISLVVNDGLVDSDPDTVTVAITSRQDQVIQSLRQAITVINGLSPSMFKNHNMPNALTNKINAVLEDIEAGLIQQALSKLKDDVLAKTGGCAIAGTPDKNDWITNCGAQAQVSAPINQAVAILQGM